MNEVRKCFDRHFLNQRLYKQLGIILTIYLCFFGGFSLILYCFGGTPPEVNNWFWWVYAHMVDPGIVFESAKVDNTMVRVCGFLMNLLNIFLFGGIFISIFTTYFAEAAKKIRNGQIRYRINGKHFVILGWDVVGIALVHKLSEKRTPIVIFSSQDPRKIRTEIMSYDKNEKLDNNRLLYILNGSFTNPAELRSGALALKNAEKIYVLGEKGSTRRDIDTVSVAINNNVIKEECKGKAIKLVGHIDNFLIYSQLKNMEYKERRDIDADIFNFYENWARRLWSHIPAKSEDETVYEPLAYKPVSKDNFVHLIIIGFGRMGQALAVEAARIAHYGYGKSAHITVISDNEDNKSRFISAFSLKKREGSDVYGWQEKSGYKSDVEFTFMHATAEGEEVRDFLNKVAEETKAGRQIPTLAICLSSPDAVFELALSLPEEFTNKELRIPILLRNENDDTSESFGLEGVMSAWDNIKFFGNIVDCEQVDQRIENFAIVLNALYGLLNCGDDKVELKDSWNKTSEYNRWSSRYQALAFIERLRSAGWKISPNSLSDKSKENDSVKLPCTLCAEEIPDWKLTGEEFLGESMERLGRAEHERWSVEKWLCGWSYDEKTNKLLHKHENLLEFDNLEEDTQNKDRQPLALSKWILENYCGVTLDHNE